MQKHLWKSSRNAFLQNTFKFKMFGMNLKSIYDNMQNQRNNKLTSSLFKNFQFKLSDASLLYYSIHLSLYCNCITSCIPFHALQCMHLQRVKHPLTQNKCPINIEMHIKKRLSLVLLKLKTPLRLP